MNDDSLSEVRDADRRLTAQHPNVLHEFPALHTWKTHAIEGKLIARIVEIKGRVFLDIREYHTSKVFEGYTSKGFRLNLQEIEKLEAIFPMTKEYLR